jgi:hypothetical protein
LYRGYEDDCGDFCEWLSSDARLLFHDVLVMIHDHDLLCKHRLATLGDREEPDIQESDRTIEFWTQFEGKAVVIYPHDDNLALEMLIKEASHDGTTCDPETGMGIMLNSESGIETRNDVLKAVSDSIKAQAKGTCHRSAALKDASGANFIRELVSKADPTGFIGKLSGLACDAGGAPGQRREDEELEERRKQATAAAQGAKQKMLEQRQREKEALEATRRALKETTSRGTKRGAEGLAKKIHDT